MPLALRRPQPRRSQALADDHVALLLEHVTKRFELGRKKKTITAVDDVSLRLGLIDGVPISELLHLVGCCSSWPSSSSPWGSGHSVAPSAIPSVLAS
jgi:hypothetical protein